MTSSSFLEVTDGPASGATIPLDVSPVVIVGRDLSCTFRIDDPRSSRRHFLLERSGSLLMVRDLKSRNGTRVNGTKIDEAYLVDGDVIQVGAVCFKVRGQFVRPGPAPGADAFPKLPNYEIQRALGRGGMGTVYLATYLPDRAPVALKFVDPAIASDPRGFDHFLREILTLCKLRHPRIVAIREAGLADEKLYLAMEYIAGCDAAGLVKKKGRVPVADAVTIIRQALEALDFIHGRGYVHRDFKPANLLLKDGPDGPIDARLADFGLAKPLQEAGFSRISFSGEAKGSLGFMPPEQITDSKSAGPPADLYAAGATLFYLVTGRRAFDGTGPHDLILKILEEPAPRLEGVPPGLADLVARSLSKKPADRPTSAKAFSDSLAPWA